ncbi:MAG: glycoside hydrolase family 127 protein [Armatimonadota bacterium]
MSILVDTSSSPHARLRGVPLANVRLTDSFWEPRRRRNQEVTLPSQYHRCEETGRIDNFRRAAGKKGGEFQGRYYNDSDVYKWVEAVAYALAAGPDPELERRVDLVIGEMADAQEPDGYLNTHFTHEKHDLRWTNLRDWHELYCAGHLIQAAIAHHRCTGKTTLLQVARRFADYICDVFGPEGRNGTCGHQEIEMALVELYRHSGEPKYLVQAQLFIDRRGQNPPVIGGRDYHQDHAPFRTLDAVTGHAVRMVYYCAGAADVLAETGDGEYQVALERLWHNMVHRRMYVTGGIGSRYEGEAFGEDFELPNDRAYAESCAAIGSFMWNWRMLLLTGEARFADLMENALYNGMLPGLSLDGELYFYQNPLADTGSHRRQPWFECACCPPNIARLLASLPGYFYATSPQGVWVHQYADGDARLELDGGSVSLRQQTRYPWDGEVRITLTGLSATGDFTLHVRIPGWCGEASAQVNDERVEGPARPGTYLKLRRPDGQPWQSGDVVTLSLPMSPTRLESHPYVANNTGRVALRRGPLVYCAEQADLGVDPRDVVLPAEAELAPEWRPELLGGVVVLRGEAVAREQGAAWGGELYRSEAPAAPAERPIPFTAIPYYAWANREPGGMAVWIRGFARV